jgi:hypothetical protein
VQVSNASDWLPAREAAIALIWGDVFGGIRREACGDRKLRVFGMGLENTSMSSLFREMASGEKGLNLCIHTGNSYNGFQTFFKKSFFFTPGIEIVKKSIRNSTSFSHRYFYGKIILHF